MSTKSESKYAWITLSASGTIGLVSQDIPDIELKALQDAVGGHIQIVNPVYLCHFFNPFLRMIVDDAGLYKDYKLNKLASAIYGRPIVGDAAICTIFNEDALAEPDIYAMNRLEAEGLYSRLLHFSEAELPFKFQISGKDN